MSLDKFVQEYDDHYVRFGRQGSGTGEWEVKYKLWLKAGYDGGSVLDYGCGWGAMIPAVKGEYVGVDISKTAIDIGKKMFDSDLRVMTPGNLKLNRKFDFVAAQSVFTHVPKESAEICLKDITRHMKGISFMDVLHGRPSGEKNIVHYEETEWLDLLESAGLKAEHIETINWRGYVHDYYKCSQQS